MPEVKVGVVTHYFGKVIVRLPVNSDQNRTCVFWDGNTPGGQPAPAGDYLLQLGTETHSFLLLH